MAAATHPRLSTCADVKFTAESLTTGFENTFNLTGARLLRSLTYTNSADEPTMGPSRQVAIYISDGTTRSNT